MNPENDFFDFGTSAYKGRIKPPEPRGLLSLPIFHGSYTVVGGPSAAAIPGMTFVCLLEEFHKVKSDIPIPTKDYDTPEVKLLDYGLAQAVWAIIRGKPVYVGCMAGKGRTGLFLSILAKAFGVPSPVAYVRAQYYPHAVETPQQYDFVTQYRIPLRVRLMVMAAHLGLFKKYTEDEREG